MVNIHPNALEALAVTRIVTLAMQPGTLLEPSIPIGDKGVSFDGHISVYKDNSLKKSSLLGRVPVQVKGKAVEKFSSLQTKYSKLELDDLRNYYNEGGVIFFVCEVMENGNVEVFAKILLPLDLKALIDGYGQQQTTTINLNHVKDLKTLTAICNHFLKEQRRQPVGHIGKHSFHSRKYEKFTVSRISFAPSKEQSTFVNHEMYFYGVDDGIEFPIGLMKFEEFANEGTTYIEINGVLTPYHYKLSELRETDEIILEHSFLISHNRKTKSVRFKLLNFYTLESYQKVLSLLEKIEQDKSVSMFDGSIEITDLKWDDGDYAEIEEGITWLRNMTRVYDKIGIPHDYVSKGTYENLNDYLQSLTEAFIDGNYDSVIKNYPSDIGMLYIRLGEDHILTFYSPNEVEKLQSVAGESFKDKEISLRFDESLEQFKISPFLLVDPEGLLTAANVTLELVKDSFKPDSHVYNKFTYQKTNQFCLECLNAYDKTKLVDYLYLVETIYDHLLANKISEGDYSIAAINYYQTLYRKDKVLSENKLQHIVEIKENPENVEDIMLRLCCNVLLQNVLESKYYFNKLNSKQTEDFLTFPIYTLYQQLVDEV
ncbi:hypothetical protein [Sporosarcina cyprini]|uniref:hypothetical protein n=1 Tax=Sporosarcina cyprini TaxID=2910523 RepID=UPI001EDDC7C3|nr:hypothetical protein [Sporosarcina cyprini]MCG3088504.1 hypothetical protein [Sporosarcina cyprini]